MDGETQIASDIDAGQNRTRRRSLRIAWAVTIAEAVLWAVMAVAFSWYWLMLPVKYRVYGVTGLSALALIGIFRIIRFHRKLR